MSFSDIKELRKNGKLREAYQLAKKEMEQAVQNGNSEALMWAKRGMSWVLYDYLKERVTKLEGRVTNEEISNLIKVLENIQKLNLPADEDMFYEQFTWKISQALKAINEQGNDNNFSGRVKSIFSVIEGFDLSQFSEPYRFLLIQLHNALKSEPEYIDVIDWWNTENFSRDDFEGNEAENGRTFSSLAEQVYTNYSKHLVQVKEEGKISNEFIQNYLVKLDKVISQHEEFKFLRYRKAQLLLALGRDDEAIHSFLPFARQNRKQTWVWELLGDLHRKDQDLQLSCYCKALSIKNKEEFKNKIRVKLAALLINKSLWDEAKTEVDKYYDFRMDQSWKVSNRVNEWVSAPWYNNAASKESNKGFYKEKAKSVDKLLYGELPSLLIIVEYVNNEKSIINFIKSGKEQGFLNYSDFSVNPEVGDVYSVKLNAVGEDGYHEAYSMEKTDEDPGPELLREVHGDVSIQKGNSFGFINARYSIFVDPGVVKKYELSDGDNVEGLAMINYDKKKKQWGWRLVKLKE